MFAYGAVSTPFMFNAAGLLIPAGSLEKLSAAILNGADAVHMGTPGLPQCTRSSMAPEDAPERSESPDIRLHYRKGRHEAALCVVWDALPLAHNPSNSAVER